MHVLTRASEYVQRKNGKGDEDDDKRSSKIGSKKIKKGYTNDNTKASYGSGKGKKIGWSGIAADNDTMTKRRSKFKVARKGKGKKKGRKR